MLFRREACCLALSACSGARAAGAHPLALGEQDLGGRGQRGHAQPRRVELDAALGVGLTHALHGRLVQLQRGACGGRAGKGWRRRWTLGPGRALLCALHTPRTSSGWYMQRARTLKPPRPLPLPPAAVAPHPPNAPAMASYVTSSCVGPMPPLVNTKPAGPTRRLSCCTVALMSATSSCTNSTRTRSTPRLQGVAGAGRGGWLVAAGLQPGRAGAAMVCAAGAGLAMMMMTMMMGRRPGAARGARQRPPVEQLGQPGRVGVCDAPRQHLVADHQQRRLGRGGSWGC